MSATHVIERAIRHGWFVSRTLGDSIVLAYVTHPEHWRRGEVYLFRMVVSCNTADRGHTASLPGSIY